MRMSCLTKRPWDARKGRKLCKVWWRVHSWESSLRVRASAKIAMLRACYSYSCLMLILAQALNWLITAIPLLVAHGVAIFFLLGGSAWPLISAHSYPCAKMHENLTHCHDVLSASLAHLSVKKLMPFTMLAFSYFGALQKNLAWPCITL